MQLVEQHIIKPTHKDYKILDELLYKSKNLYNATLYAVRQHYFNEKTYISYYKLQPIFQHENQVDYVALPRKVSQQTMKMVDQNFRSFFSSLKATKLKGKKKSIPHYLNRDNGRYEAIFTNQAISLPMLEKKGYLQLSGTDIHVSTRLKSNQINQVRVVPHCGYISIEIIYTVTEKTLMNDNNRYGGIDIGVNNLAVLTSNIDGFQPTIYNGKLLKSYNHYYNKKLARLKSILETRNNKKSSKRIRKLTVKRNNKVKDYLHKTSTKIVKQISQQTINTLIVGKNDGWKQATNIGKKNNQNFVQIPHATFINMLEYKCRLAGINFIAQEESYTSKCDFLCEESIEKHESYMGKRVSRGVFQSGTGKMLNADVNGSYNILRKCKPTAFIVNGVQAVVVQPRVV